MVNKHLTTRTLPINLLIFGIFKCIYQFNVLQIPQVTATVAQWATEGALTLRMLCGHLKQHLKNSVKKLTTRRRSDATSASGHGEVPTEPGAQHRTSQAQAPQALGIAVRESKFWSENNKPQHCPIKFFTPKLVKDMVLTLWHSSGKKAQKEECHIKFCIG